jgi:DNA-directed RNA polymerase specialized sigma24 family protein
MMKKALQHISQPDTHSGVQSPRILLCREIESDTDRIWTEAILWVDENFGEILSVVGRLMNADPIVRKEDIKSHAYIAAFEILQRFLNERSLHSFPRYFFKVILYQCTDCWFKLMGYKEQGAIEKIPDTRPIADALLENFEEQDDLDDRIDDALKCLTKRQQKIVKAVIFEPQPHRSKTIKDCIKPHPSGGPENYNKTLWRIRKRLESKAHVY